MYALCLLLEYLRTMQLFYMSKMLGPKIIMIQKMVCCWKRIPFWYRHLRNSATSQATALVLRNSVMLTESFRILQH